MSEAEQDNDSHNAWLWVAAAAGLALGVTGAVWLVRYRDPVRRMNRLLRRCQERINGIEASLSDLESALGPASSS
jgi:hypothetical protein